mgnify:CR=1 FL=1
MFGEKKLEDRIKQMPLEERLGLASTPQIVPVGRVRINELPYRGRYRLKDWDFDLHIYDSIPNFIVAKGKDGHERMGRKIRNTDPFVLHGQSQGRLVILPEGFYLSDAVIDIYPTSLGIVNRLFSYFSERLFEEHKAAAYHKKLEEFRGVGGVVRDYDDPAAQKLRDSIRYEDLRCYPLIKAWELTLSGILDWITNEFDGGLRMLVDDTAEPRELNSKYCARSLTSSGYRKPDVVIVKPGFCEDALYSVLVEKGAILDAKDRHVVSSSLVKS